MAVFFKNTKKDIIMTEEDVEDYGIDNICRFCETDIEYDKNRDHCHLTDKYRGPAHSKCNKNVTQDKSNYIPFVFHNYSNYDCHLFFKTLVDKKKDKVKFKIIPKTNEVYISVKYRYTRFIDSYRFLSNSLESLVKTLVDNIHKTLKNLKEKIVDNGEILNVVSEKKLIEEDRDIIDSKKDLKKDYPDKCEKLEDALLNFMGENDLKILRFPDEWKYLNKKLANPYEFFNSVKDYEIPVDNLKKKHLFTKLEKRLSKW